MPSCAFLTVANQQGWFIDDQLVYAPLQQLGWDAADVAWDANVDWNKFDAVVIRSPWDYQHHLHQFLKVLERVDQSSALLFNSLDTIRWNIDKTYLFDLQKLNIDIIPTLLLENSVDCDIAHFFDHFNSDCLVIKPSIGAGAEKTYRIARDTPKYRVADIFTALVGKNCLVQPFVESIAAEGEFSLMYFDGVFSHCILKTPAPGDFRVQEEHGGGVLAVHGPEAALMDAGHKVMSALSEPPLYARVDLVRTRSNTFALMELELIEPSLYFRFAETASQMFAAAIHRCYARSVAK